MPQTFRRLTVSLAAVALLGLAILAQAPAWGATLPAAAQVEIIPGMPQRIIKLPPVMTTRLRASKQKADLAELQRVYFVRDQIPHLRVVGREYRLLPVDKLAFTPSAKQLKASQTLVGPVAKYRDLIVKGTADSPTLLPPTLDRRPQQSAIKDQNPRGTCYAFASIAALEAAYGGGSLDLSENYANYWFMQHEGKGCKSDGVGGFDWGAILQSHAVCQEAACPYQASSFPSSCNNGVSPPPTKRSNATSQAPYGIAGYTALWRDESVSDSGAYVNNPTYLRAVLASGKEVVVGLFIAGWTESTMAGLIDVRLDGSGNPLPSSGGHVMLVVGYDHPNQYFLVKNSWGSDSGHAGYLHISYDYFRTYAQLGYVINQTKPTLRLMRPDLKAQPLPH